MQDELILELFWKRSEDAVMELSKLYGPELLAFSLRILGNLSDAEECLNDAYLGAWNTIPPHRPEHLLSYMKRIVRNQSINRYHKNKAQKRNSHYDISLSELEACISSSTTVETEYERQELTKLIDEFLAGLSTENRVIFLRRYWHADSYADIALRMGITQKNVSVRLVRLRKQLSNYLKKRGVFV